MVKAPPPLSAMMTAQHKPYQQQLSKSVSPISDCDSNSRKSFEAAHLWSSSHPVSQDESSSQSLGRSSNFNFAMRRN